MIPDGFGAVAPATLIASIRARVRADLPGQVEAIDRDGLYPRDTMRRLGEAGLFAAHLADHSPLGRPDLATAIAGMAEVSAECMSTGFCTWCQDALGWYIENCDNQTLRDALLGDIATGAVLAGTGMSNPLKSLSGIEGFLLKARRVPGGYEVSGVLPWVSNLGDGHWLGTVLQDVDDPAHLAFAAVRCGQPGVQIRQSAHFIALEGTGTYSVAFRKAFIADDHLLADPVGDLVARITPGVILLQTGMGLGVIDACVTLMRGCGRGQGNAYLPRDADTTEAEAAGLRDSIARLASTPTETGRDFLREVLRTRLAVSELALAAAQSALLHAGARGYLAGSAVNRRLRESYFVAIITPSIRHLRQELARLEGN